MTGFNVYLGRKWIDKVFYADGYTAAEVKRGLVNHDGYDPGIKVTKERKKKNRGGLRKAQQRFIKHGFTPQVEYKFKTSVKRRAARLRARQSVTLKNMASVTIIRRRNGTVGIRGVKK
jgi:hypothetical protein